jgi:hypothetical protein
MRFRCVPCRASIAAKAALKRAKVRLRREIRERRAARIKRDIDVALGSAYVEEKCYQDYNSRRSRRM